MMTIKASIQTIHHHLTDTFAAVDSWFDQPEDLRNWRPADGGWTINEILEHISLTNFFLLKLIDKGGNKALKLAEKPGWETTLTDYTLQTSALDEVGRHLSFQWIRPEHMEPQQQLPMPHFRSELAAQQQICLDWLSRLADGQGTLYKTTMTVNNLGKIDVYQYIYFLSLHAQRHLAQMARNAAQYPQHDRK